MLNSNNFMHPFLTLSSSSWDQNFKCEDKVQNLGEEIFQEKSENSSIKKNVCKYTGALLFVA